MGEEAEKTTLMILNVDLQCSSCYKKVKKVICKFPQIKGQNFDEKANKVFISVVCCSPEKIRDKLCCKGCGVIKSIEIVPPPKQEKSKPNPDKSKVTEKLEKTKPKIQESKPVTVNNCFPAQPPYRFCSEGIPGGPCYGWYGRTPPPCYGQDRCPVEAQRVNFEISSTETRTHEFPYEGGHYMPIEHKVLGNYYCDLDNSSCSIM